MKQTNCRIIGLTGGIASGKSTASNILKEKGFKVIEADIIARKVVEEGEPSYKEVIDLFGNSIVNKDKTINRKALGEIVFSNEDLLRRLNQITHPRIYEEIIREINKSCEEYKTIFIDIPLLFEEEENINKHNILFDQVWLVYVDESIQLERLMKRNDLSKGEALDRIKLQIPLERKKEMANIVIDNNRGRSSLNKEIEKLIDELG